MSRVERFRPFLLRALLCAGICAPLLATPSPQLGADQFQSTDRSAPFRAPVALIGDFRAVSPEDLAQLGFDPGPALGRLVASYLSSSRRLNLARPYMLEGGRSAAPKEQAQLLGADLIFSARYSIDGQRMRAELFIYDTREDDEYEVDEVEGLLSAPGQIAYSMALAFLQGAEEEDLSPELLSLEERREINLRFRPSREPFEAYARGLSVEAVSPEEALWHYREALSMEPYFNEARDRSVYAEYLATPNRFVAQRRLNRDYALQLRAGRRDLFNYADMLTELAVARQREGNEQGARQLYEQALRALRSAGRGSSSDAAWRLHELGLIEMELGRHATAFNHLYEARNILDALEYPPTRENAENLASLAAAAAIRGRATEALDAYERLEQSYLARDQDNSVDLALLRYNRAVVRLMQGGSDPGPIFQDLKRARRVFFDAGWVNSELYIECLVNEAAALRLDGELDEAEALLERARQQTRMLGLEEASIYFAILSNKARLRELQGDAYNARRLEQNAARARGRSFPRAWYRRTRPAARSIERMEDLFGAGFRSSKQTPQPGSVFFTRAEEDHVRAWTGAFNINRHNQRIRSRTYAGRQDDTNVLLFDLLNDQNNTPGLERLRDLLVDGNSPGRGEGLFFVDIGPAIANYSDPGVTARSLARDFPAMQVVALDLPQQVHIFLYNLPAANQAKVLRMPNLHVLAGDGYEPLRAQFDNPSAWKLGDRKPPRHRPGQPLILRAANSIDIYGSWEQNQAVFQSLGRDFKASPVLYFFNQAIVFKPAGETRFRVIGFVSIRGFHHNRASLDRGGDPPYTLPGDLFAP